MREEKNRIRGAVLPVLFILGFLFLSAALTGCGSAAEERAGGGAAAAGADLQENGKETTGTGVDNQKNGKKTAGEPDDPGARLQVVTSIFPQYDFARHIAGDAADVYMLLKPGEEVHSYEPTPQDIRLIQGSDLFIYTGGENDVWIDSILESIAADTAGEDEENASFARNSDETSGEDTVSGRKDNGDSAGTESGTENAAKNGIENTAKTGTENGTENAAENGTENGTGTTTESGTKNGTGSTTENATKNGKISVRVDRPRPHAVRFLDLVGTYAEEQLEGMMPEKGEHDHAADEEEEEEPDEHVWTSPANCAVLIEKLTEEFCALDPQNADQYRANGQAYRAEFEALDEEYRQMVLTAARKTIIFGDRFPFRYLAEEYGLTCYAAFSGCSAESEPSAATIAFLIEKTVEEEVPVVFTIEFSNGNIARAVSEAAQARLSKRRKEGDAGTGQGSAAEATEVKKGNHTETGEEKAGKDAETGKGNHTETGEEKAGEDAETGKGNHTEAGEEMGAEPEAADAVSVGTGESGTGQTAQIRVLRLHSCHNLTRDEFAAGETCLSLMKQNLEALRTALN